MHSSLKFFQDIIISEKRVTLAQYGKNIEYGEGAGSFLLIILWIILPGLEMAVLNVTIGLILYISIVGIPFGKQFFKFAKPSLMPFGSEITEMD